MIPQSREAGVECTVSVGTGKIDKETLRFVDRHPEIVLTVLDSDGEAGKQSGDTPAGRIKKRLGVPLVLFDRSRAKRKTSSEATD